MTAEIVLSAIISGSLRRALYRDSQGLWLLPPNGRPPVTAAPHDVAAFGMAGIELAHGDAAGLPLLIDTLRERLDEEIEFAHGLDNLLLGMDPDFGEGTRRAAILNSETILGRGKAASRIQARFLRPVDASEWSPVQALSLASDCGAAEAARIYRYLADGVVDHIAELLTDLIKLHYGTGTEAEAKRRSLIQSGLIAEVCGATGDRAALLSLPFRMSSFPALVEADPQGKVVAGIIKRLAGAPAKASSPGKAQKIAPINREETLEDLALTAYLRHSRQRGKANLGRGYEVSAIDREIRWITDRVKLGEIERAEVAVARIVVEQSKRSRVQELARTLTQIADQAREARQFGFAHRILGLIDLLEANDATSLCVKGETLYDEGRREDALQAFEEATQLFPDDEFTLNSYGKTLRSLGYAERALDVLANAREKFPEDQVARNSYAEVLKDLGRFNDALNLHKESMERFPFNPVTRNSYAEILREVGRSEEALNVFAETMKLEPNDSVARNAFAETLRELGRSEEALSILEETIERFEEDEYAYNVYAAALGDLGKVELALAFVGQTVERFPRSPIARNVYGDMLRQGGRLDEALNVFLETREVLPYQSIAHTSCGETLRDLGRDEEAQEVFSEAIRKFPRDPAPLTSYADFLRYIGRVDEGISLLRKGKTLFPYDEFIRNSLGHALSLSGDLDSAETLLGAVAKNPCVRGDWIALHILAMGHLRHANLAAACAMFARGAAECPFVEVSIYFRTALAVAHLMSRRADKAVLVLEALASGAATSWVHRTNARLLRAHALGQNGNRPAALVEISQLRAQSGLSAKQLRLAQAIATVYSDNGLSTVEHLHAANDNLYEMELELITDGLAKSSMTRLAA